MSWPTQRSEYQEVLNGNARHFGNCEPLALYPRRIKVVYIAGTGRCGTTLLARLLGETDGYVNVGHASRYLFHTRMLSIGIPCGCGNPVLTCPFWKDIAVRVPPAVQELGARFYRLRRLPFLLAQARSGKGASSEDFQRFLSSLAEVFEAIARRTEYKVIVDSGGHPLAPYVLSLLPNLDVYVIHLVRNPQGVVASWAEAKEYLPKQPARRVVWSWCLCNILSEFLRARARKYWRVRFEDLIATPKELVEPIAQQIREAPLSMEFLRGDRAELQVQHMLAGNPDKFTSGQILICDRTTQISPTKKLLVNLFTFPLLYRYGYLFANPVGYGKKRPILVEAAT